MKLIDCKAFVLAVLVLIVAGCKTDEWIEKLPPITIEAPESPENPSEPKPDPIPEPEPDRGVWRKDVASIDGLSFTYRNMTKAPGNGRNKDGGFEWIVTRLSGEGFDRCLVMVMGGNRPSSRIYYQGGGSSSFQNNVFQVPRMEPTKWEVVNDPSTGKFSIKEAGKVIYTNWGTVNKLTMHGYRNRESTGEWQ